jgi:hypothetical protein
MDHLIRHCERFEIKRRLLTDESQAAQESQAALDVQLGLLYGICVLCKKKKNGWTATISKSQKKIILGHTRRFVQILYRDAKKNYFWPYRIGENFSNYRFAKI